MSEEQRFTVAIVTLRDQAGTQTFQRYCCVTTDHEDAARQALTAFSGMGRVVLEIETYDGPPRRWDHDVKERGA